MNTLVRTMLLAAAMTWSVTAMAAAPSVVSGVAAEERNGEIVVQWDAVQGAVKYRVYFSSASILRNNGDYDDFEETTRNVNVHTLRDAPKTGPVYIAVLAVNAAGEESPLFVTETSVRTGNSSAKSSQAGDADWLRPVSIEVTSATGVVVTFNHPVLIDPRDATTAFTIEYGSGLTLAVMQLEVRESYVIITTAKQVRTQEYTLRLSPTIHGKGTDHTLNLDENTQTLAFRGHQTGLTPPASSASSSSLSSSSPLSSSTSSAAALKLTLTSSVRTDKTYDIHATWMGNASDIESYRVNQSRDGGNTFGNPQTLPADATQVRIERVPAGTFLVQVQSIRKDGSVGDTARASISLQSLGNDLTGDITKGDTGLPESGPAMLSLFLIAGGVAGWSLRRYRLAAYTA